MTSNEIDYKSYIRLAKANKRLIIVVSLVIMTAVTLGSYLVPDKYEAKSTVFIEQSVIAELVKGLAVTPSVEDKIKVLTYAINSRTLISKVLDDLDLRKTDVADLEKQIKSMQESTEVKVKDKEGLFIISFKDKNPKIARDYVNALVRKYIDENTSSKREESYGASQFLSEQLKTFKEKLERSEQEANSYRLGEGAVANMDPSSVLKDISDSQQRADELKIRQSQLESQLAGLARANSVQSNLPVLQRKLHELQLQYTDNYPEIIRLKEEIRALSEQKRAGYDTGRASDSPEHGRIVAEIRALRQAEANLRSSIAANRGLLQKIPAARANLDALERDKNSQKELYETMLARQGQSEVSKQMELQDKSTVFRIVDPAVLPAIPSSPDRAKLILFGILGGIAGGFGVVLLKDQLDHSVKSSDMARQFGLPVLAVIPRIVDPQLCMVQAKQDRKLYVASAAYFSIILIFLGLELAGVRIASLFS